MKVIQQGHYIGWPGLTAERVDKYLTPKIETALGHMHKIKQGTKSTAVQPSKPLKQLASHDLHIQTIRTDTMEGTITPKDSRSSWLLTYREGTQ